MKRPEEQTDEEIICSLGLGRTFIKKTKPKKETSGEAQNTSSERSQDSLDQHE